MPFERNDMQYSNNVSAYQGFAAQCAPTSSRVSDAAYGGESSVGPIPNGVPSGFAQPAQGFHGSEPLTHGSEGDNNTGLQVLESPDDPLLTFGLGFC